MFLNPIVMKFILQPKLKFKGCTKVVSHQKEVVIQPL